MLTSLYTSSGILLPSSSARGISTKRFWQLQASQLLIEFLRWLWVFTHVVSAMRQSHIGARCDQTVEHVLELGPVTVLHPETVHGEKIIFQRPCCFSLFLSPDHLQDQQFDQLLKAVLSV